MIYYYNARMGSAIYCYLLIVRTRGGIHNILSRIEHNIGVPVYTVTRCPLL